MTANDEHDDLILLTNEVEELRPSPELFHGALTLYAREILSALKKCGFRRIAPIVREEAPKGPHYAALRGGRPCCICLQPVVADSVSLDSLTSEQCAACDDLFPDRDIYYSALLESDDKLYLFPPILVKDSDGWLRKDSHVEQFLPMEMSAFSGRFRSLLGGCADFKLFHIVIPYVLSDGETMSIRINGIGFSLREEPYFLFSRSSLPYVLVLAKASGGKKKNLEFVGVFFYYEHEDRLELELVRRVGDEQERGIVELMEGARDHSLR